MARDTVPPAAPTTTTTNTVVPILPVTDIGTCLIHSGLAVEVPELLAWLDSSDISRSRKRPFLQAMTVAIRGGRLSTTVLSAYQRTLRRNFTIIRGSLKPHTFAAEPQGRAGVEGVMARNEMIRDALECLSSSGDDAVNVYFVKLRPLLDAYPPGKRATAFLAVTTILVKWITALGQKRHHDASRLRADLIAMGLSSDPAHSIHFARPGYLGPVIAACYEENDIALGQDILKTTMLHAPDAQCWSYNLSLTFMSPLYRSLRTELEVPVTWEPLAWLWGYTIGRFVLVNIEKDEQTIAQGGKRRASDVVAEREALDANKRMVCDLYEIMPEEERARILGKDFARVNATMLSVMTPTPTPDSSLATDASLAGDLPGANAEDRALPHPTRPHSIHRPVPIPPLPLVPLATTSSVTARPSPHPQVSTRVEPPSAKVSVASRAVTRAPHPEGSSAATQRFDRPTKASSSKTGGKRKAEELEPPNDQEPTAGTSADAGPSEKRQKMTTRRTVNEGLMKRGTAYLSNAGGSSAGAVLSGSSRANIIS